MNMIFKSLWAHKKQNGWIFAEIAIISCSAHVFTSNKQSLFLKLAHFEEVPSSTSLILL